MSRGNLPSQPKLTPQFCFDEKAVRDFLRLSRSAIDDPITEYLNALITPAEKGFDPSVTQDRQSGLPPSRRQIDEPTCQKFQKNVLFPAWQSRSDVVNYCAGVATSPDPDDPEVLLRQEENQKLRERIVDERLDPYSGRYFPREPRTEQLASMLRMERSIENIVRSRTWGLVRERCGGSSYNWEEALNSWRKSNESAAKDS
ncbi:hypothetical protein KEM56_005494 [Ascosphaera pollenicola]|nr:hypothetical protein KEM56_005494 [Ascosphaera pollenicola]